MEEHLLFPGLNCVFLKYKHQIALFRRKQRVIPIHNEHLLIWINQYVGGVNIGVTEAKFQISLLETLAYDFGALQNSSYCFVIFLPKCCNFLLIRIIKVSPIDLLIK